MLSLPYGDASARMESALPVIRDRVLRRPPTDAQKHQPPCRSGVSLLPPTYRSMEEMRFPCYLNWFVVVVATANRSHRERYWLPPLSAIRVKDSFALRGSD